MKKIFWMSVLTAATLFAGSLSWDESVRVERSKPVFRNVTIRTPYQACWDQRVPVYRNEMDVPAAALIGGVAGGVLGHQIGRGKGREAATMGGAVVGALMGADIAQRHRRINYRKRRLCETRYDEHRERRLVHYKNIAWYKGHRIVKLSRHPLRRIHLHITMEY